ncbi:metal ABC transporter permease [Anaerobacillus sp. MEB173]|uniref:metal ABC transporter permease n=1 Tax=Anaerobacillus sp. MEB173 TaxID=3383345 RepID=UPI003F927254
MAFDFLYQLTFIERGIVAGLLIGFICPLLGSFLLVRRITIVSEALSHITLTGIAAGILLTQTMTVFTMVNPLYMGLVFSLVGSLLVERLRQIYKHFQELAVPIILSSGIGLSAIIISISKSGYNDWFTYLFGSVVSVTVNDLFFMLITTIIVVFLILFLYKEFVSISFDQEFAKTSGMSIRNLNILFSLLVALVITISMKVVGILLVGAMITLPVAASIRIAKSFKQVIFYGILFGEAAILSGIYFSYHFNIATGGVIVLSSIIILLIVSLVKRFFR